MAFILTIILFSVPFLPAKSLFFREIRPIVVLPVNWPVDLPLYQVKAFDNETGSEENITYKLIRPSAVFTIDGQAGNIYVTSPLKTNETIAVSACLSLSDCALSYISIETVDQNFCINGYKKKRIMYQVFENMQTVPLGPALSDLMDTCNVVNSSCKVRKGGDGIFLDNGVLYSLGGLDREHKSKIDFTVQCISRVEGVTTALKTVHDGSLYLIDKNDNPPFFQSKQAADRQIRIQGFLPRKLNKVGSRVHFHDPLVILDADSQEVNNYDCQIVKDNLKMFEILPAMFPYIDGGTIIGLNLLTTKEIELPEQGYVVEILIKDKSFMNQSDSEIRVTVSILTVPEDGPREPPLLTVMVPERSYQIDIYQPLNVYTRIFNLFRKPILLNTSEYYFELFFPNKTRTRGVQVTLRTGILYISDPEYLEGLRDLELTLRWSRLVNGETLTDTSAISIKFHKHFVCEGKSVACSTVFEEDKCKGSCGLGAVEGHCQWKPQNNSATVMNYATCSPDVRNCPDKTCDELEELDPRLCPQDCTEDETMGLGALPHYSSQKGIQKGHGTCSCDEFLKCSCYPNMHSGDPGEDRDDPEENTEAPESESQSSAFSKVKPVEAVIGECDSICIIIVVLSIALTLLASTMISAWVYSRKKTQKRKYKHQHSNSISLSVAQSNNIEEQSPLSSSNFENFSNYLYGEKEKLKWLFPKNRLKFLGPLGEGEFGRVLKAYAYGLNGRECATTVAVKMLKDRVDRASVEDLHALKAEFSLLKDLVNLNVIKLLGICVERDYPCIIMEYCELGSLKNYLRSNRPTSFYTNLYVNAAENEKEQITNHQLLSFAWQIAKGMAYLSDMKLVHRDLAARNVLLNANKVCKISDFGLTRDIYEADKYLRKSKGKVPVKWMALESIRDNVYTIKSDVWSYGIVLWEVWTYGSSPYPGVSPERMFKLLCEGYRMECPKDCPAYIYEIMKSCWRSDPDERPLFRSLKRDIDQYMVSTAQYIDLEILSAHNMSYQLQFDPMASQVKSRSNTLDADSNNTPIHYSTMMGMPMFWKRRYENVAQSELDENQVVC